MPSWRKSQKKNPKYATPNAPGSSKIAALMRLTAKRSIQSSKRTTQNIFWASFHTDQTTKCADFEIQFWHGKNNIASKKCAIIFTQLNLPKIFQCPKVTLAIKLNRTLVLPKFFLHRTEKNSIESNTDEKVSDEASVSFGIHTFSFLQVHCNMCFYIVTCIFYN